MEDYEFYGRVEIVRPRILLETERLKLVERKRAAGEVLIPSYLPYDVLHTRKAYIPGTGGG